MVKSSRIKNAYHSIFTKLLLVIIITGFMINFFVLAFYWLGIFRSSRIPFSKNAVHYINYLIEEIGTPPLLENAQKIARKYFFDIRFSSPEVNWSTSDKMDALNSKRARVIYNDSKAIILHSHGLNSIIIEKNYGKFTFNTSRGFNSDFINGTHHVVMATAFSACLLIAFIFIRRLLRPIKWLNEGVREVSDGNFEYKVPQRGMDEFGELAGAFNQMTKKINNMLHAREQLMLDVSHELRTPITRMKVAMEFVADGKAKENIKEDISEMEEMVTEILETARLRNVGNDLVLKSLNPADIIIETAELFKHQPPGIEVNEIPSSTRIMLDPGLFRTVLKNIFTNAIKYSEKNGPPVIARMRHRAGEVVIEIIDKGVGISKEELPHVFEPFYRADKSRSKRTGGYGLGLSLCKTIIHALNGKIDIDSAPGMGTTVTITFQTENV